MARRGNAAVAEAPAETVETENSAVETTVTAAPATAAPANGDKAELTDEQVAEALAAFHAAVESAQSGKDATTGVPTDEGMSGVNAEYRKLNGIKLKNKAKAWLNDEMSRTMKQNDIPSARCYLELTNGLSTAGPKRERAERVPADPTEAFVERAAALYLAGELVGGYVPEGVSEDWGDKAQELTDKARDEAEAYRTWILNEDEDKGDAPDASAVTVAAVKLSLGRSAKPGKSTPKAASNFDGPRRDIARHISEAFADKAPGTFMKISEIRNFRSSEYGDDLPSAGAISARLFPKKGNCTLADVKPDANADGDKGATKI
jgi:hypothetical protein